jgi:hypothetical protein
MRQGSRLGGQARLSLNSHATTRRQKRPMRLWIIAAPDMLRSAAYMRDFPAFVKGEAPFRSLNIHAAAAVACVREQPHGPGTGIPRPGKSARKSPALRAQNGAMCRVRML